MTQSTIPLVATPSQTLTVQLGAQSCQINVRQRRTGMFVDLLLIASPGKRTIFAGVKALDRNRLVREAYLDFTGDLFFVDTQGLTDPTYDGLGGRYQLYYDDSF